MEMIDYSQWILAFIALFVILWSSIVDIKKREVPDVLSYSLIAAALGVRAAFSFEFGWEYFIAGLLGLFVAWLTALVLYYSGQWGGGDSKLLMGMGVIIGVSYPFSLASLELPIFMLVLLLVGSIYGMFWILGTAVVKHKIFLPEAARLLKKTRMVHIGLLCFSGFLFFMGKNDDFFVKIFIVPIAIYYIFLTLFAVENRCFVKNAKIEELVEGDWLAEDIEKNDKKLMFKRTISLEDIEKIKSFGLRRVKIKEGVPFVPGFLFAYLIMLFASEVYMWFFRLFL